MSKLTQISNQVRSIHRHTLYCIMKKTSAILALLIIISCSQKTNNNDWELIRKSESITEYQDYLIANPETENLSEAIDSLRYLWKKNLELDNYHHSHDNAISLLINSENQILFNREPTTITELENKVKYVISNPDYLAHLPETKSIEINDFGIYEQSKGIIDIKSDNLTEIEFYSKVLKHVINGFHLIRNDLSLRKYGIEYEKLNTEIKDYINQAIPIRIRFERHVIGPEPKSIQIDSLDIPKTKEEPEI